MKRKIIVVGCVLTLAISLTACGKNDDIRDLDSISDTQEESTTENEADTDETEETPEVTSETKEETEEVADDTQEEQSAIVPIQINTVYDSKSAYNYDLARYLYDGLFYSFLLAEEDRDKYPQLAKTLDSEYEDKQVYENEYVESSKGAYQWDEDYFSSNDVETPRYEEEVSIARADSNVFSVMYKNSNSGTGTDNSYYYIGRNYDVSTGTELKLTDVVKDPQALLDKANEQIQEEYVNASEQPIDLSVFFAQMTYDELIWTIDYQGVNLYFDPYSLGSGDLGGVDTKIYFADAPGLFDTKYTQIPESYVISLTNSEEFYLDIDGDGQRETLSVTDLVDPDYSDYCLGINLTIGDKIIYIDEGHFSSDYYIVCEKGKYYLMGFLGAESDYTYIVTADLNEQKYLENSYVGGNLAYISSSWNENNGTYEYSVEVSNFTDPDKVMLSKRFDYLGTMSGRQFYHIGDKGYLVPDGDMMIVNSIYVMTAKKDIACKQVDYDGNVIGESTIKEGSHLLVIRGDGESYADLIEVPENLIKDDEYYPYVEKTPETNESTIFYRVEGRYSQEEYILYINGEAEGDLFDNLMFAG